MKKQMAPVLTVPCHASSALMKRLAKTVWQAIICLEQPVRFA